MISVSQDFCLVQTLERNLSALLHIWLRKYFRLVARVKREANTKVNKKIPQSFILMVFMKTTMQLKTIAHAPMIILIAINIKINMTSRQISGL